MKHEAKLFIITHFLLAVTIHRKQAVATILNNLFPEVEIEEFLEWINHYKKMQKDKHYSILLLREYGLSYPRIQKLIRVSPNTIQYVTQNYEVDFKPFFKGSELDFKKVEDYLQSEGVDIL